MKIPIVSIGNSKGIRIPQAVLRQVAFGDEVELFVSEGKIILKRITGASRLHDFSSIAELDDALIQRILLKISGSDMVIALVGSDDNTKNAIYRNLSEPVKEYVIRRVGQLEAGDAKEMIIEQSRSAISRAILETLKE